MAEDFLVCMNSLEISMGDIGWLEGRGLKGREQIEVAIQ